MRRVEPCLCAAAGRGVCERTLRLQSAVVVHVARSMPPSLKVMPHGTFREVVANSLALRARPRPIGALAAKQPAGKLRAPKRAFQAAAIHSR
jgi:hypothetical protein